MNLETSLNAYRASSSPSITISDAQAEWVLKWAEKILAQISKEIVKQEVDVEQAPMWKNGYFSALGNSADIIRSFQSPTEGKGQDTSPTEQKECGGRRYCSACRLNETCKEHEEHHD